MAIKSDEITIRIKRTEYKELQRIKLEQDLKTVNDAIKHLVVNQKSSSND